MFFSFVFLYSYDLLICIYVYVYVYVYFLPVQFVEVIAIFYLQVLYELEEKAEAIIDERGISLRWIEWEFTK